MGYCADGNGEVFLKDGINIKELKNKLDNLNSSIDYNIEDQVIYIPLYLLQYTALMYLKMYKFYLQTKKKYILRA